MEKRGHHLWITEDARLLAEGEIGCHKDRGALIEEAHQMEQHPRLSEEQIAELVEDDEIASLVDFP
jgi:hypothetical protein